MQENDKTHSIIIPKTNITININQAIQSQSKSNQTNTTLHKKPSQSSSCLHAPAAPTLPMRHAPAAPAAKISTDNLITRPVLTSTLMYPTSSSLRPIISHLDQDSNDAKHMRETTGT